MVNVITFEKSAREDVLSFFDKTIDENGFIVEKEDPTQKVITPDGEEITIDNFAGIRKGSEIFIKSDRNSLINLTELI